MKGGWRTGAWPRGAWRDESRSGAGQGEGEGGLGGERWGRSAEGDPGGQSGERQRKTGCFRQVWGQRNKDVRKDGANICARGKCPREAFTAFTATTIQRGRDHLHDGRAAPLLARPQESGDTSVCPLPSNSWPRPAAWGPVPSPVHRRLVVGAEGPGEGAGRHLEIHRERQHRCCRLGSRPTRNPEAGPLHFRFQHSPGGSVGVATWFRRIQGSIAPRYPRPCSATPGSASSRFRLLQIPPPMRVPLPPGSSSFRFRLLQVPPPSGSASSRLCLLLVHSPEGPAAGLGLGWAWKKGAPPQSRLFSPVGDRRPLYLLEVVKRRARRVVSLSAFGRSPAGKASRAAAGGGEGDSGS